MSTFCTKKFFIFVYISETFCAILIMQAGMLFAGLYIKLFSVCSYNSYGASCKKIMPTELIFP